MDENRRAWIERYWKCAIEQSREELRGFFCEDAVIRWHNTDEQFSVEEYLIANCDYPGDWAGSIERIEDRGDLIITVVNVFSVQDASVSACAVSFFRFKEERIFELDEYWGDRTPPPVWRQALKLGSKIK